MVERRRFDLGMVKPDEIFVQISPCCADAPAAARWKRCCAVAAAAVRARLHAWGSLASWLELIAPRAVAGDGGAEHARQPAGWPLAIVSLAAVLPGVLGQPVLYGEASLQIFFAIVAMGLVAMAARTHGRRRAPARAACRATPVRLPRGAGAGQPALALFLRHYTDSDVPGSTPSDRRRLVGQWLFRWAASASRTGWPGWG